MINKKAAMEMSMGTIIILVLGVSMLILGMVLIRSIMCSGIQISEDLSAGVKNEIINLFGADSIGVKCIGQGGAAVKLGTGGRRAIPCIIKTENQDETFTLKLDSIASKTTGVSDTTIKGWVVDQDWTGKIQPGKDNSEVVVLLNLPKTAPQATLELTILATSDKGYSETITSYIDIVPTGFIKGAIC
jgi:hypothetical protein